MAKKERVKRRPFTEEPKNDDVKSYSDLVAEKMNRKAEETKQDIDAMSLKYDSVFSTPNGKEILKDILAKAGILSDPTVPGDFEGTLRNIGRQSLGLYIINRIQNARRKTGAMDIIQI